MRSISEDQSTVTGNRSNVEFWSRGLRMTLRLEPKGLEASKYPTWATPSYLEGGRKRCGARRESSGDDAWEPRADQAASQSP